MSRLENSMSPRQLYNIALAFINHFIKSYDEPPKVIIRLFMHSAAYVLLHTFRSEMLKFSTNSLSSTFPRTIYSWGQSGMVRAYVQLTWSMNPLIWLLKGFAIVSILVGYRKKPDHIDIIWKGLFITYKCTKFPNKKAISNFKLYIWTGSLF